MATHECVGWVKKYCEEAYGIKWLSFWGSAINGWNRKWNLDNFFDRVDMPKQWDVVFFHATPSNKYGHVAIHNDYDTILEQNWWNWNGNWLWINAIRLAKAPTNSAGFMRPKFIDKKITTLRQYNNPDCTLGATMNCAKINTPYLDKVFTQELLNEYMPTYFGKTPKEAFYFLKEKWHEIRIIQLSYEKALIMLNKWIAVVGWLKWYTQWWLKDIADDSVVNWTQDLTLRTKWHAIALVKEWEKIMVYDSNVGNPYEIDLDLLVKENVVKKTFYLVR